MHDGVDQEARDTLFLSQLGKELQGPFPSRWTCPQVQPWLYGYDASEEVEDAVKHNPFPPLAVRQKDGGTHLSWSSTLSSWLQFFSDFSLWRIQR